MNRPNRRRRLALLWWRQLILTLAPLVLLLWLVAERGLVPVWGMGLFVAGLVSMFVSLPLFRRYKRALIDTERALDTPAEDDAWVALTQVRQRALLGAGLPAWIAALAVFAGLEAIPLLLLAVSSLVLLIIYRIPRQLG